MEAKANQTDIQMTARKLRRVINEVRGKAVVEAQNKLRFMPYFAAKVVETNLKAAVANAKEQFGVNNGYTDELDLVFENGVLYREQTFEEIRSIANSYL